MVIKKLVLNYFLSMMFPPAKCWWIMHKASNFLCFYENGRVAYYDVIKLHTLLADKTFTPLSFLKTPQLTPSLSVSFAVILCFVYNIKTHVFLINLFFDCLFLEFGNYICIHFSSFVYFDHYNFSRLKLASGPWNKYKVSVEKALN